MRMCDDDCFHLELMTFERFRDSVDLLSGIDDDCFHLELLTFERFRDSVALLSGIDDDCFTCLLVTEDRAVALNKFDWQDDMDHSVGAPIVTAKTRMVAGIQARTFVKIIRSAI